MASILTHEIITNATASVNTYSSTANGLFEELGGVVSALVSQNFTGDASDGYNDFFTTKVTPALTENLESLTSSINSMLESIQTQLLDQVDPQLGNTNRNPG